MSIYICAVCDNYRDADDGCQEHPYEPTKLVCEECFAEEFEDEEDDPAPRDDHWFRLAGAVAHVGRMT